MERGFTAATGVPELSRSQEAVIVGFFFKEQMTSLSPVAAPTTWGEYTSPGIPAPASDGLSAEPVAELRRVSGLTWDQLARLFGVSRRSLHFWGSGKPMARANEEHLQRLLAVIRGMDRGAADLNRRVLLSPQEDGVIPFDLLVERQYERAAERLGKGRGRPGTPPAPAGVLAARAPPPPGVLVSDGADRVPASSGRLLWSKPVRGPRGK